MKQHMLCSAIIALLLAVGSSEESQSSSCIGTPCDDGHEFQPAPLCGCFKPEDIVGKARVERQAASPVFLPPAGPRFRQQFVQRITQPQRCPNTCNLCQRQNQATCACENLVLCPAGQILNTDTCQCSCVRPFSCNGLQQLNTQTCQCECTLFLTTVNQVIPGQFGQPTFLTARGKRQAFDEQNPGINESEDATVHHNHRRRLKRRRRRQTGRAFSVSGPARTGPGRAGTISGVTGPRARPVMRRQVLRPVLQPILRPVPQPILRPVPQRRLRPGTRRLRPGPATRRFRPGPATRRFRPGPATRRFRPGPATRRFRPGPATRLLRPRPGTRRLVLRPVPQPILRPIPQPRPRPGTRRLRPRPGTRRLRPGPATRRLRPRPGTRRLVLRPVPQPILRPILQPRPRPGTRRLRPRPGTRRLRPRPGSRRLVTRPALAQPVSIPLPFQFVPRPAPLQPITSRPFPAQLIPSPNLPRPVQIVPPPQQVPRTSLFQPTQIFSPVQTVQRIRTGTARPRTGPRTRSGSGSNTSRRFSNELFVIPGIRGPDTHFTQIQYVSICPAGKIPNQNTCTCN